MCAAVMMENILKLGEKLSRMSDTPSPGKG